MAHYNLYNNLKGSINRHKTGLALIGASALTLSGAWYGGCLSTAPTDTKKETNLEVTTDWVLNDIPKGIEYRYATDGKFTMNFNKERKIEGVYFKKGKPLPILFKGISTTVDPKKPENSIDEIVFEGTHSGQSVPLPKIAKGHRSYETLKKQVLEIFKTAQRDFNTREDYSLATLVKNIPYFGSKKTNESTTREMVIPGEEVKSDLEYNLETPDLTLETPDLTERVNLSDYKRKGLQVTSIGSEPIVTASVEPTPKVTSASGTKISTGISVTPTPYVTPKPVATSAPSTPATTTTTNPINKTQSSSFPSLLWLIPLIPTAFLGYGVKRRYNKLKTEMKNEEEVKTENEDFIGFGAN